MKTAPAFRSGVLAIPTDCIKVIDLDGRPTFTREGGRKVIEMGDLRRSTG